MAKRIRKLKILEELFMVVKKKKKRTTLTKKQIKINKKKRFIKTKKFAKKEAKKNYKKALLEWVIAVKTRDNWTCQICGKYLKNEPKNCQVHHIIDKKNFKSLAMDMKNGIVLCYWDHKNSPLAPHLNVIFFAIWLETTRPEVWEYLKKELSKCLKKNKP